MHIFSLLLVYRVMLKYVLWALIHAMKASSEVSEGVREAVEHYFDFQLMSREEVEKRLEELQEDYPELGWIRKDFEIVAVKVVEGGLALLLDIDGAPYVLELPSRKSPYNPYELRVRLYTILFSDEDICFSDGIAQHGYIDSDEFDFENYDKGVEKELREWEGRQEVIEVGDLRITKRGVIREVKCYVNIPHYHYYEDAIVVFETRWIKLYDLLRVAPLILAFV